MKTKAKRLWVYVAQVEHLIEGRLVSEEFPIRGYEFSAATSMAVLYVVEVMGLKDFKLRVIGL